MTDVVYTMGLDLGQTRNYTAMVVMKRVWQPATAAEFISSGGRGYQGGHRYTLVRVERVSLGTPYPRVVDWVKTVAKDYGDELTSIVVDASGVGSAVVDALRKAEIGVSLIGVVITGDQASPAGTGSGVTAARFEVDRPRCREWDALRRELSVGGWRVEGRRGRSRRTIWRSRWRWRFGGVCDCSRPPGTLRRHGSRP